MRFGYGLAMVWVVGCGGCAAIPLAAVGSALGIAGSVAGTGADVYGAGKLDSAEPASFELTRAAVLASAQDLGFHALGAWSKKDAYTVRLSDDLHTTLDITLDPRTPSLTRLRINVGVFGSEPTAKLILQRIRQHLDEADPSADPATPEAAVYPADRI